MLRNSFLDFEMAETSKKPANSRGFGQHLARGMPAMAMRIDRIGEKALKRSGLRHRKKALSASRRESNNSVNVSGFDSLSANMREFTAAIQTSTSTRGRKLNMITQPDHLVSVRYVKPGKLQLVFEDSRPFSLAIEKIGMPVDRIDWPTAKASPGGESMVVMGLRGDPVPVDSTTLRYLVDTKYAAKVDAKLESLQFSDEELERIVRDNPAPQEWYDQPTQDLTRESWK